MPGAAVARVEQEMSKGCTIREVELGGKNEFFYEYVCKGERVGAIHAARKKIGRRVFYVVRGVNVLEPYRRKRIATRLYEKAAAEACRRRVPLASDERIGGMSAHFWDKQIKKGRASVVSRAGGFQAGEKAPVYALMCPAPKSLEGTGKAPVEHQCKPMFSPEEIKMLKIPRAEQMEECHWKCVRPFQVARLEAVKDPTNYAVLHPSTKEKGKWQLSLFDKDGPWGDRVRKTCSEAAEELRYVFPKWRVTDWE